jgi:acyl-CoA oxidase
VRPREKFIPVIVKKQRMIEYCEFFRPNIVGLVDAFDMHDETVASTLGQYNGNAYQNLFESTQYEPMNQTEVCSLQVH